jgi:hypothetical protein
VGLRHPLLLLEVMWEWVDKPGEDSIVVDQPVVELAAGSGEDCEAEAGG